MRSISEQTWLRMSAAHFVALARLRLASNGSAIDCLLSLLRLLRRVFAAGDDNIDAVSTVSSTASSTVGSTVSISLGWRRCGVRLQALGVARGRRHGLLELANVSGGDAAADLREALGAARLPVAENLLAKQILCSSNATLRRRHCQSVRPALAVARHDQSLQALEQGADCQAAACCEEDRRRQEEALQDCLIGTDQGLGSPFAARFHDAPALNSLREMAGRGGHDRNTRLRSVCGYMIDVLFAKLC